MPSVLPFVLLVGAAPGGPGGRAETVRWEAVEAYAGITRKLVWAVLVLGLALGGKDLLGLALQAGW